MNKEQLQKELNFLERYHNNLPNDWLFEKKEVVARLISEYAQSKTEQLEKEIEQLKQMANDSFKEAKIIASKRLTYIAEGQIQSFDMVLQLIKDNNK